MSLHWIVCSLLFAPLVGGCVILLLGKNINQRIINFITLFGLSCSFLNASFLGIRLLQNQGEVLHLTLFSWMGRKELLHVLGNFGCYLDQLAIVMLILVGFISLVVSVYSTEYMKTDKDYKRFFVYMLLFTFAMQILVTADNLLLFFFGWEALALISFLLIGFYFTKEEVPRASLQAILINRLGDAGLLIGIGLLFTHANSLEYQTIFQMLPILKNTSITILGHSYALLNVVVGFLFIGVMAKSAQIPLHIWLPDSMVGPTPASALIHAATMVTTGIYMMVRLSPLIQEAQQARVVMLGIGATTALLFAAVAVVSTDIKRILAFSTVSQLGYMVCGIGVGHYADSMLHLVTHACFKALLFLGAGAVIKSLHGIQSIHEMGQLRKPLPFVYFSFLIGALALVGIPPFSGFYSKDRLIHAVYLSTHTHSVIAKFAFYCLVGGVAVTAFYMSRLILLVFHGEPFKIQQNDRILCKPGITMQFSLLCLTVPSLVLGWALVHSFQTNFGLEQYLDFLPSAKTHATLFSVHMHKILVGLESLGIIAAYVLYIAWPNGSLVLFEKTSKLQFVLKSQYGITFLLRNFLVVVVQIAKQLNRLDFMLLDQKIILGVANATQKVGHFLKRIQSGYLRDYLFKIIASVLILLCLVRIQFRV